MRKGALGLILVLVSATCARAEGPSFTIKIKAYPDKGQSLLCRDTDRQTSLLRFRDSEGNVLDEQKPVE